MIECENVNGKCNECGNDLLLLDINRGEVTCDLCGLVLNQKLIDQNAEWSSFTREEFNNITRTGAPSRLSMHDRGLSTVISWKDKDAAGKKINSRTMAEMNRLRTQDNKSKIYKSKDKNLYRAMIMLEKISSQLNLSNDVQESAAFFYRKLMHKNLCRGRSIEGIMTGSIYLVCRRWRIPITMDDLSLVVHVNRKQIYQYFILILKELKIRVKITTPTDYVATICSELKLSKTTQNLASSILERIKNTIFIIGKRPKGLAGAVIYIAARKGGENRTQKEISIAASMSEATIRNLYKPILKIINQ